MKHARNKQRRMNTAINPYMALVDSTVCAGWGAGSTVGVELISEGTIVIDCTIVVLGLVEETVGGEEKLLLEEEENLLSEEDVLLGKDNELVEAVGEASMDNFCREGVDVVVVIIVVEVLGILGSNEGFIVVDCVEADSRLVGGGVGTDVTV